MTDRPLRSSTQLAIAQSYRTDHEVTCREILQPWCRPFSHGGDITLNIKPVLRLVHTLRARCKNLILQSVRTFGWALQKPGIGGAMQLPTFAGLLRCCAISIALGAAVPSHSALLGWAVGANGTIVMTPDGGTTWVAESSGVSANLNGVQFVSSVWGVAVGNGGVSVHTTDGGLTWSTASTGTALNLNGVAFFDPLRGVAVGTDGVRVRTTDGGLTWSAAGSTTATLYDIAVTGASSAIAVGAGGITVRTTDSGLTWSSPVDALPAATTDLFDAESAVGGSALLAVGAGGTVTKTTDGGATWSVVFVNPAFGDLFEAESLASNEFLVTGASGNVSRSTDGGFTWNTPVTIAPGALFDLEFIDAPRGLAVGAGGNTVRTTDGGFTWSAPIGATSFDLYALALTTGQPPSQPVPEPMTLVLIAIGIIGIAASRRRSS